MKNLGLLITLIAANITAVAQVSFSITEPASIAGGYTFTSNGDAADWGLADLNDPADAVLDTVMICEDGTPGINAQGIPFSNEACAPLTNDLTGKIAFCYRYDGVSTNSCWISTKVLNAQNAGAVGVIVVNRDEGVTAYGGLPDGPSTNIPFAFISKGDGAVIRAKLDAGDDVVAFIGNKFALYEDDAGITGPNTLVPTVTCTPAATSLDNTEFGFDVGTKIYNYGSMDQPNVMLTASVTGPPGVWTETVGPFNILAGDSVDVFTGGTNDIPAFSFATYPAGTYTMNYTVDLGVTDSSAFDNSRDYTFVISDDKASYADMNTTTGLPEPNQFTRSTDPNFTTCMEFSDANASRLGATGIHFAGTPAWDATIEAEGEICTIILYEWNDAFVDLNDAGFGFASLNSVAEGEYVFGAGEDSVMIFAPFDDAVVLQDNQRYLACVNPWHEDINIGYNNRVDYTRNINLQYLQPLVPNNSGGTWYGLGFGEEMSPAIALGFVDANEVSIVEAAKMKLQLYPNPAQEELTIALTKTGNAQIHITDLSGRTVLTMNGYEGKNIVDVSGLQSGQYVINITSDKGAQFTELFSKL